MKFEKDRGDKLVRLVEELVAAFGEALARQNEREVKQGRGGYSDIDITTAIQCMIGELFGRAWCAANPNRSDRVERLDQELEGFLGALRMAAKAWILSR